MAPLNWCTGSDKAHLAVVRFLCEAGAEKNQPMKDGRTPLNIASAQAHLEVVRFLCEAGAEKNQAQTHGIALLT